MLRGFAVACLCLLLVGTMSASARATNELDNIDEGVGAPLPVESREPTAEDYQQILDELEAIYGIRVVMESAVVDEEDIIPAMSPEEFRAHIEGRLQQRQREAEVVFTDFLEVEAPPEARIYQQIAHELSAQYGTPITVSGGIPDCTPEEFRAQLEKGLQVR